MCSENDNKTPVQQVEEQINNEISDVDECLEQQYSITLDQLDDLQGVKDELESAKSTLDDIQYQMEEITSAISKSAEAISNADYHG